ncbi:MAG: acetolactate decarboxylase, partial [archaeon]|nr:acetolactate decarboxylase [archaeon]
NMTYGELKKHGDCGLGTFNGLDGEMIGLDGRFYQVKDDGIAYPVDDSIKTPFALVTFFEVDNTIFLDESLNYTQLEQYLDGLLPREDIIYAFEIEGTFEYIKTRSVPKQDKPYPPFSEVVKNQTIFEFHDVTGTIVGFWFPDYMEGVNALGYHFHFITEDRMAGGHLLDCQLQNVMIEIDYTYEFYMILPESDGFYEADLLEEQEGCSSSGSIMVNTLILQVKSV